MVISAYLQTVFACPDILLHDTFYDILDINHPIIIKVFKFLAYNHRSRLFKLAHQYHVNVIDHPSKLIQSKLMQHKFHTVWIVKRLLDESKSITSFTHWALKFEGISPCYVHVV